jgi:two-component system cell cycle response regulator
MVAERLRNAMAKDTFRMGKSSGDTPVTISVGITTLADTDTQPADLLKRADEALYRAKNGGRNKVEVG